MGAFSIWHWLLVLAIALLMFGGRGKISALMGDFGKGLTSFKKGMKEGDTAEADEDAKALKSETAAAAADTPKSDQTAKS
ncbi:MAG: twin-arginine translocase TatA/TatE family subunit [Proteobacteria bacterium]|nr:twin-arginine translocase TatA/TatE family subunit [Pseudomonadota bacterium]MDA1309719.1 twin-arginine translocase TatA/TatE family subunit [Pseudomonadota bacterium]